MATRENQHRQANLRPTIVGICGGSGSGKTTLTQRLIDRLGPQQARGISFDSYYRDLRHLSVDERSQINFDHPDSLDDALLIEHLRLLRANKTVAVPDYDFSTYTRSGGLTLVEPTRFVIIEGILLFAFPEIRSLLDHRIFQRVDTEVRAKRRLDRDVTERGRTPQSVLKQWETTVEPMHQHYVEPFATEADVITTTDQTLDEVVEQIHFTVNNVRTAVQA